VSKILFTGGSSFVLPGEWKAGDPFTGATTLSAVVDFSGSAPNTVCTVTQIDTRNFEIYASAVVTATWPKGVHLLRISRSDADYFSNGDDLVDTLEAVQIEVR
jgi:hypothetical protein